MSDCSVLIILQKRVLHGNDAKEHLVLISEEPSVLKKQQYLTCWDKKRGWFIFPTGAALLPSEYMKPDKNSSHAEESESLKPH